jgi:hypothetical protein
LLAAAPVEKPAESTTFSTGLPPPDAPLASILDALVARADAGDGKAACRLALELMRCREMAWMETMTSGADYTADLEFEEKGDLDTADRIATANIQNLEWLQQCRAVPDALLARAGDYLVQAARAGVPEAMIRYADGSRWHSDGRGLFSDPGFDAWRQEAPAMMERAFHAGVPEAPFYLMLGHQSNFGLLAALIPDDPIRAEAMHMLMVRMHGWTPRPSHGTLDAASHAEATALARQWHEGPFKGRNYAGRGRSAFGFHGAAKHDGKPHEFCVDDPIGR